MREAVEKSLNVPAVKTLQSLGIDRAVAYTARMNLPIERKDFSLSLALGGMESGFSLAELSSAYCTFANGGIYQPCGFIENIKINASTIYTKPTNTTKVFSQETTYLVNDVLRTTVQVGTAKKLRSLPCEISAKTGTVGTTNGNTDAYALSYTTNDLVSVWLGNADNKKIDHTGGGLPCSILLAINECLCNQLALNNLKQPTFSKPATIQEIALDKTAYQQDHVMILADETAPPSHVYKELFKPDAIPLNKSTSFSNPTIEKPIIEVKNGNIIIRFCENNPQYYTYKIERTENNKTVVLYNGPYVKEFTDKAVKMNTRYIYTITPIYNGRAGTPISLPSIHTITQENDGVILEKHWWEY
jgi:membrane peptidoglycan carboxypeptidase